MKATATNGIEMHSRIIRLWTKLVVVDALTVDNGSWLIVRFGSYCVSFLPHITSYSALYVHVLISWNVSMHTAVGL